MAALPNALCSLSNEQGNLIVVNQQEPGQSQRLESTLSSFQPMAALQPQPIVLGTIENG
jgi:hypothetical protein